jgi:hypothetical protein
MEKKEVILISLSVSIIVFLSLTTLYNFLENRRLNLLDLKEDTGYQFCGGRIETKVLTCDDRSYIKVFNKSIEDLNKFIEGCKKVIVSDSSVCVGDTIIYHNRSFG